MYTFLIILTSSVLVSPKSYSYPRNENLGHDDVTLVAGQLGRIRGLLSQTTEGRPFLQFRGIPYAHSSSGDGRFMPSVLRTGPLVSSGDTFNATEFGPRCPQQVGGEENCLFLNVATATAWQHSELAPVIVYVHGAAFVYGRSNDYEGQRLLNKNLVVVSFNYRLGVFGYLGFGHDLAPGNAALYDAINVLNWVQLYIHYFGGNPDLVTISGQSSGAASVTHLLLSPLSTGLFHRAIALSGTALNAWATTYNPVRTALKIAALVNCTSPKTLDTDSSVGYAQLSGIMACLKTVSVMELIRAQGRYQASERKAGRHGFIQPSITFDGLQKVPTVLPDFPVNIMRRQEQMKVPLMVGATKQDGEFSLGFIYAFYLVPNGLWKNPGFLAKDLIPKMMELAEFHPGGAESQQAFTRAFLGNCSENADFEQALPGLMDASTVLFFKAAALQLAELHSKSSPTFLYSFDFKGTHTLHNPNSPFPGGVAHSDDTQYLFYRGDYQFNRDENQVSQVMTSVWENFAKTGFPDNGYFWPPFSDGNKYMIIDIATRIDNDYTSNWIRTSYKDL